MKIDSDTEGDAGWMYCIAKNCHSMSDVKSALFNCNSTLWSTCLFNLPRTLLCVFSLNWWQVSLNKTHALFLQKVPIDTFSILVLIFLLVSFKFDILSGPASTSEVICCSRYLSSHQATGVREKFLPLIKWSEIKMLPQHVPRLLTLKETGPLAALTEATQFPKTTQFDWIQYCDNTAGWLNER